MNENIPSLFVGISQPFASAELVFGLAQLADELLVGQVGDHRQVRICHRETHYEIKLEPALDLSFPHKFVSLLKLIETVRNSDALPQAGQRWNYEQQKRDVSAYFELRKTLTPAERSSKASPDEYPRLHELSRLQPDTNWYGMALVNQMQALTGYNEVAATWLACENFWPELLALVVGLWGYLPNDAESSLKKWQAMAKQHGIVGKEEITASQAVNPEQGKGANRAKADALTIGNQSSFWLEEAMKFAGIFVGAVPRTVSGSKDRKTYVLLPKDILLSTHRNVYRRFQRDLWPATAVKLDILAALRYSELFVQQLQEGQSSIAGLSPQPGNYVQGLATAFYKDLGSAVATLNLATINVPTWIPSLNGKEGARQLEDLFAEHITIIQVLDESKGGEEALLRSYRDFLSSHDPQLTAFFDFTTAYAAYVMGKLVRRQYAPRFTTKTLEVIVMTNDQQRSKKIEPIIRTQGFQNIAEAIRRSTVIPQYQKNEGTRTYDIRYGLGERLKRKARYPLQFIEELSDFMHLYNQENARVAEKQRMQFRKAITTQDIAEVAGLLDEYGDDAPAVAYLLIAYGYARDTKEREPKAIASEQPDVDGQGGDEQQNPDGSDVPDGNNLPF